jgi:hypothetical protein
VISASFVQGYTLTVATAGTGTGDVTASPAATVYPPGTKVTLRAEKDVSSTFAGFSGDCTTNRASCTVTMNKHATVTAAFNVKTFKVKTTVIGNGTVSLDEPASAEDGKKVHGTKKPVKVNKTKHETKIDYGDQLVYRITPEPGSYIEKVVVDGKSQGSVEALTVADVKRNHSVKVKFESETKTGFHNNVKLVKRQIFLRDDDQDEAHTPGDLTADDDDNPIEPSSANQLASVKK